MEEIFGSIENIIFVNEENGFTVAKIREKDKRELTCIVGNLSSINSGEMIRCEGKWLSHSQYGKQFEVSSFEVKAPTDLKGIQKYLESGLIKGIGPVYAQKIVEKFGLETLDIIEQDPFRLMDVDGIGEKRVKKIKSCWDEQKSIRNVMIFLRSYDISSTFAEKIFKCYGNQTMSKIKENPYQLAKDIIGIGFKIADKIAFRLGIDKNCEKRIESGIEFTLWELSNIGHSCYPKVLFLEEAKKILDVDISFIQKVLDQMILKKDIIISSIEGREFLWLKTLFFYEEGIAKFLNLIHQSSCSLRRVNEDKALIWVENLLKIKLAKNQIEAIKNCLIDKIHIITGGPGTGKSTITKAILEITHKLTSKIILAAPTGKAAKRMAQITKKRAVTIHSLLEYDFVSGTFQKNEENKLKCSLIIIDESSMIDTFLMFHLLRAIPHDARVIFIGDIDQLPSVGPGNILKDMIDSKTIKITELSEIFRQAKNSKIITNAHKINKGFFPELTSDSDFRYIEAKEPEILLQKILSLVTEDLPKMGFDPIQDIQVLAPMKKGIIGTENLNIQLQAKLNPSSFFLMKGSRRFQKNDKIMQIKNNYNKHVYNGDVGIIIKIDSIEQEVLIKYDDREVTYEFSELDEIVHAYAVSVHKYQGSESLCIIMPIHTSHFKLLFRNLLYTAVTRGKKMVYLIGMKQAIAMAIKNDQIQNRYTGLCHFLKKIISQKEVSFSNIQLRDG